MWKTKHSKNNKWTLSFKKKIHSIFSCCCCCCCFGFLIRLDGWMNGCLVSCIYEIDRFGLFDDIGSVFVCVFGLRFSFSVWKKCVYGCIECIHTVLWGAIKWPHIKNFSRNFIFGQRMSAFVIWLVGVVNDNVDRWWWWWWWWLFTNMIVEEGKIWNFFFYYND